MAVIAGRWISTKLSVKKITIAGAGAFIFFAFLYAHEAYTAGVNGDVEW
jgi:putative Ca2+/H+ antiporter (TMEM165/GDT1 family)